MLPEDKEPILGGRGLGEHAQLVDGSLGLLGSTAESWVAEQGGGKRGYTLWDRDCSSLNELVTGDHFVPTEAKTISQFCLCTYSLCPDVAALNTTPAWDFMECWEVSQNLGSRLKDWQASRSRDSPVT